MLTYRNKRDNDVRVNRIKGLSYVICEHVWGGYKWNWEWKSSIFMTRDAAEAELRKRAERNEWEEVTS